MKKKRKLLWVSYCMPYDKVPHAGGQTHNYYLKGVQKLGDFEIHLITFAQPDEVNKADLDDYGISYELNIHLTGLFRLFWNLMNKINQLNVFDRKGGIPEPYVRFKLKSGLRHLFKRGYQPDVVVLQWTQMVLFEHYVKKLFPDTAIVSIEEDVSFLSYQRKYAAENNVLRKFFRKKALSNLMESEKTCLKASDLVVLSNHKDNLLLMDNGVSGNTWEWSPYFQSLIKVTYVGDKKDILFYGAMNRAENWQSAIWFIKNVWTEIRDPEARFVIVGNRPNPKLLKYTSDRIITTGYVDDLTPYFRHSMCLVAPLLMGAGVKIKIIEGLSAGIPVLTNRIGIEGIDAIDRKHYFHCETPMEYIEVINRLLSGEIDGNRFTDNEKLLIKEIYNYKKSLGEFNYKLLLLSMR